MSSQATFQSTDGKSGKTMTAMVYETYGSPSDVLTLREIERPTPGDDEVLVKVDTSSVNALDWHMITETPYFMRLIAGVLRPKRHIPGADISGVIEATGRRVTRLKPGDEVYGEIAGGGFAEYVVAKADLLAPKPENLSLEETASLGVAALTALQGLRDWGQLKPGQKVLINGGSGGVGTFAIQLAKTLGASEVAVVCSTRNVKNARSLGADQVIDYTKEDFTELGQKFDVMFDNVGNRPLSACRSMLTKRGRYVMITGPKGRWIAPVPRLVAGILRSIFWSQKVVSKTAVTNLDDLLYLKGLVESGQLKPLVERRLALKDASEALADQGHFHAVGKTLIKVDGAL